MSNEAIEIIRYATGYLPFQPDKPIKIERGQYLVDGIQSIIATRNVLRNAVEVADNHVRELTSMLNRACHIGIESKLNSQNDLDQLNDFLDYIQENNLLDW